MSLYVYTENDNIANVCSFNDKFFNKNTLLTDSNIVKRILRDIDGAVRVDNNRFQSKFSSSGIVSREFLSTGCKTALNIVEHPDTVFSTIECGINALDVILTLHEGKILWYKNITLLPPDQQIDISWHGRVYNTLQDFLIDVEDDYGY